MATLHRVALFLLGKRAGLIPRNSVLLASDHFAGQVFPNNDWHQNGRAPLGGTILAFELSSNM